MIKNVSFQYFRRYEQIIKNQIQRKKFISMFAGVTFFSPCPGFVSTRQYQVSGTGTIDNSKLTVIGSNVGLPTAWP